MAKIKGTHRKSKKGLWIFLLITIPACVAAWFIMVNLVDYPLVAMRAKAAEASYKAAKFPWTAADFHPNPPVQKADNAAPLLRLVIERSLTKEVTEEFNELSAAESKGEYRTVSRWMVLNNDFVNEIVAATRPNQVDFGRDWAQGMNLLFPEYAGAKRCCRILALSAANEARAGRIDLALDRLEASRKIGALLNQEPIMIALLVSMSCDSISLGAYESVAGIWAKDNVRLERLANSLKKSNYELDWKSWMDGEAYMGLNLARNLPRGHPLKGLSEEDLQNSPAPTTIVDRDLPNGMIARAHFVRHAEFFVSAKTLAEEEGANPAELGAELDRLASIIESEKTLSGALSRLLIPVFSQGMTAVLRAESTPIYTLGLIDGLIYRNRNGRFPTTPGELGLGTDPLTGKQFGVKSTETSLVVYSFGLDGIDDGGKERFESPPGSEKKADDLSARFPRMPRNVK